jgi:hypothetical protein
MKVVIEDVWHFESACGALTGNSSKLISRVQLWSSGSTRGQIGQGSQSASRRLYILLWKLQYYHNLGTGCFIRKDIISAVKWQDVVYDTRGRWCDMHQLRIKVLMIRRLAFGRNYSVCSINFRRIS